MSLATVKRVAMEHLALLSPTLPTSYESFPFTPPEGLYQRLQFSVSPPDDPVIGDRYYRERVQLQIFVNGPAGVGTGLIDTRAELIRTHFYKGLTLIDGNMRIYVLRTPQIGSTIILQDRVVIPVLINLVGEVYE